MPQYVYACRKCGDNLLRWCTIKNFTDDPIMQCLECDLPMEVVIQPPLLVKAAPDVCYDSPITGEPVTSWAQRREDLSKHDCVPYDPEMKTDYLNRIKASDQALDQSIETHVERTIEKMPTRQRGKLMSDLLDKGEAIEYARGTVRS
jgi:hypothetical protein